MRLGLKLFLGFFLIVGIAAFFVMRVFVNEVKPGVRQAMESTLVDAANVLAVIAAPDLKAGHMADGAFAAHMATAQRRDPRAMVWRFPKRSIDYRVTVTDARGIVIYDSLGQDVGRDNSRWNDVYLTLRGQYGARSSARTPGDETSTVMHVAAPVYDPADGRTLIGVLTLAQPNDTFDPFIAASQRAIVARGAWLIGLSALIGLLMTWWLARGIGSLSRYAKAVSAGEPVPPPRRRHDEIGDLGQALETMRRKLEGKAYVEQYVQSLTHEMKSPLAAIRGAAELLQEPLPEAERQRFAGNIVQQERRLTETIDQLLRLAEVEQHGWLQRRTDVDLVALCRSLAEDAAPRLQAAQLQLDSQLPERALVQGDAFLLRQALSNLLDNAIAFSPAGGRIELALEQQGGSGRSACVMPAPGFRTTRWNACSSASIRWPGQAPASAVPGWGCRSWPKWRACMAARPACAMCPMGAPRPACCCRPADFTFASSSTQTLLTGSPEAGPVSTRGRDMTSLKLLLRFAIVGGLALLLLIPLLLIRGTINERERYRDEAVERVAQSYAGEQTLVGPVRVLPWTQTREVEVAVEGSAQRKTELRTEQGYDLQMPARLDVQGKLETDERRIGLFKVPVYRWHAQLSAEFAESRYNAVPGRVYGRPYLALGLSDVRGLVGTPNLRVDGKSVTLQPGAGVMQDTSKGLHAPLSVLADASQGVLAEGGKVQLEFVLGGTRSLSVAPIGDDTRVALNSPWQHPLFGGSFLPNERSIDGSGFKAEWAVSSLASAAQTQLVRAIRGEGGSVEALNVALVDPVDVYTQADRATKYGILFVLLTFVGFALFELIKQLKIHPLQYLLVGLALAIFFLLLVSLSEHIPFWQAYLVSAAACIGLQGFYLSGVLRSWKYALVFSTMLTLLYGVLYLLLASETNSLLMGSLLLFGILAVIMWITRKMDWYELSSRALGKPAAPPTLP